jgi:hypothetical protein
MRASKRLRARFVGQGSPAYMGAENAGYCKVPNTLLEIIGTDSLSPIERGRVMSQEAIAKRVKRAEQIQTAFLAAFAVSSALLAREIGR